MKIKNSTLNENKLKKSFSFKLIIIIFSIILVSQATGCKTPDGYRNTETEQSLAVESSSTDSTAKEDKTYNSENTADSSSKLNESGIIINIGSLKGPTSIGMIKLHKEKPALGENIVTYYEIVPTPDIMISKILSGEIDIATLPTNVALKLYNKGVDIQLAAITGYGVLYMLYQNNDISNWDDLKNKKINITSKGSTPDVIFRYLLSQNQLEAGKELELDYSVEQVELSQLLISGKADIAILPEPFVTMVLNKNNNLKIGLDIESEWKKVKNGSPLPMSCLVVSGKTESENKNALDLFLGKYAESIDWVNSNLSEAAELVEEFDIGMDRQTAYEAIPRCNIQFMQSSMAEESINVYIETILDFSPDDVGGKMPDEKFYY